MNSKSVAQMLLTDQIRSTMDSLGTAEKKIAEYVLSHDNLIYKTINEVIDESGAGYGTVIRYCKKLGCSGFQDFKIRLAFEQGSNHAQDHTEKPHDVIREMLHRSFENLRIVERNLKISHLEKVVEAILEAKKILVIGVAGSFPTALELTYRLVRFGFDAEGISDEHLQAIRASVLTSSDLLIAVSFSGATSGILHAMETARRSGATTVSITNFAKAPIVSLSDHVLFTATWEEALEAEVGTRLPFYFIIEVLTKLIIEKSDSAAQMVKRTFDSVSSKQI